MRKTLRDASRVWSTRQVRFRCPKFSLYLWRSENCDGANRTLDSAASYRHSYFAAHSGYPFNSSRSFLRSKTLVVGTPVRKGMNSMETDPELSSDWMNLKRSGSSLAR